ncbi:hypothetical protein [Microcoleus sp. FACHB-1515]|nr:hypothetical protein [Microcoleus sp. FACHB-1515]
MKKSTIRYSDRAWESIGNSSVSIATTHCFTKFSDRLGFVSQQ